MIQFTQILSDDDFIKAGAANYRRSTLMKIRFVSAIVLIVAGALLVLVGIPLFSSGEYFYSAAGVFGVIFGILNLFRKRIYVNRLVKIARSSGKYGSEIDVRIDDDGMIEFRQDRDENRSDLRNFYGYGVTDGAILLYPQKNLFLILRKESIGDSWDSLLERFSALGLKRVF